MEIKGRQGERVRKMGSSGQSKEKWNRSNKNKKKKQSVKKQSGRHEHGEE